MYDILEKKTYLCATIEKIHREMNKLKHTESKLHSDAVRHERLTCLVNDEEMRIIDGYLRKYGIENKSRWMRETLLAFIHRNLDYDYPTLFNEHDMRR